MFINVIVICVVIVASVIRGQAITPFAPSAFCISTGLTPSDGTQITAGACSSTPQGAIPAANQMVSTIIINPSNAETVDASIDMVVSFKTLNLDTGFFDDPATQYYLIPQTLSASGIIQGHQHVTIQNLVSLSDSPDPQSLDFFKGVNGVAVNGLLSVTVPAGTFKNNGVHRICTITGSDGHQPVIMPVAKRGSQDDCIRINVVNAGVSVAPSAAITKNDVNSQELKSISTDLQTDTGSFINDPAASNDIASIVSTPNVQAGSAVSTLITSPETTSAPEIASSINSNNNKNNKNSRTGRNRKGINKGTRRRRD